MAKFKNHEEATKALEVAKEKRNALKGELDTWCKEHKLAPMQDHSGHEKLGKEFKKLQKPLKEARAEVKAIEEEVKALKPKKEKTPAKYTYPDDCVTDADKKKYRSKMRAAAAKAEKGEAPKKEKEEKKSKKAEPVKEEKSSSKKEDKKKPKKKEKASSED